MKKTFYSNVNSELRKIHLLPNKVVELTGMPLTFKKPVLLHSVFPHMHYRGKSFRLRLISPNKKEETIFFTPRYSFLWQHTYTFARPILIPAGGTLIPSAYFDNTALNRLNPNPELDVYFGPQSTDEMLLPILNYTEE